MAYLDLSKISTYHWKMETNTTVKLLDFLVFEEHKHYTNNYEWNLKYSCKIWRLLWTNRPPFIICCEKTLHSTRLLVEDNVNVITPSNQNEYLKSISYNLYIHTCTLAIGIAIAVDTVDIKLGIMENLFLPFYLYWKVQGIKLKW